MTPIQVEVVATHNRDEAGWPRSRFVELRSNKWVNIHICTEIAIQRESDGKFTVCFHSYGIWYFHQRRFDTERAAREFVIKAFLYE